jgi:hypothetical protein
MSSDYSLKLLSFSYTFSSTSKKGAVHAFRPYEAFSWIMVCGPTLTLEREMKGIFGICILFCFFATSAIAQDQKALDPKPMRGQHIRSAGNSKGEFTRRETSTVRRVERHARRWERKAEKQRAVENDHRTADARRWERSISRKRS